MENVANIYIIEEDWLETLEEFAGSLAKITLDVEQCIEELEELARKDWWYSQC